MKMKMQVLLTHWHLFIKQHGITHHNKQSTYGNLKLKYVCFVFLSRNWFMSAAVHDEGSYCFCKVQMVSHICLNTNIR